MEPVEVLRDENIMDMEMGYPLLPVVDKSENITIRHPSDAGGDNDLSLMLSYYCVVTCLTLIAALAAVPGATEKPCCLTNGTSRGSWTKT